MICHFSLGNTCYVNAVVQYLRSIPELRAALDTPSLKTPSLSSALLELYASMERTKEVVAPVAFLHQLRQDVPQFGENEGAQQGESTLVFPHINFLHCCWFKSCIVYLDANECLMQIINSLRDDLGASDTSSVPQQNFVRKYM